MAKKGFIPWNVGMDEGFPINHIVLDFEGMVKEMNEYYQGIINEWKQK